MKLTDTYLYVYTFYRITDTHIHKSIYIDTYVHTYSYLGSQLVLQDV